MSSISHSIQQGEGDTLEFKSSFNDEVIVSLVAFANTKGGTVFIGLNDDGSIKGVNIGKETIQQWVNEIKNKTSNIVIPETEVVVEQEKTIVIMKVQEYPIKPVAMKGKYYKRTGNSNHLMSVEEIANEHLRTINTSWDYYVDPNHSLENISFDKVMHFIEKIEQNTSNKIHSSPVVFLSKMEILREEKLTFGAYLLFVADYCPISDIQIGRFKSDVTIIDSLSLNTDLFSEVDEVLSFIKKHLMVEYIITGEPQRIERFDYPPDAIREIVINMVVHRDYRDSSGSVIKIFDNRIEFYNPGKLYGGITIEDLLRGNYTSKSRNKLIAKAFKEAGLIERYGTGVYRIQQICREYGLIEPVFREIANGFQVTLFKEKQGENVTENVTEKRGETILNIISKNPYITTEEIGKILKVTKRTIIRDIEQLKNDGKLIYEGPQKGGCWKIL